MAVSTQSRINALDYFHDSASTAYLVKNKTALIGVNQPCTLFAIGVKIGVVLDSNAATCIVTRRVTIGSDTNAVAVDTLYIPNLTAAGTIIYIELATPTTLNVGDELKYVFSNHGGSCTWMPWYDAIPREETKANQTDLVVSVDV